MTSKQKTFREIRGRLKWVVARTAGAPAWCPLGVV